MKTYYVRFGTGDPRLYSGLSPTFLTFSYYGSAITPPGITSVIGATGFYAFQYGVTTPIAFLIDGATTGLTPGERYVSGAIDPSDAIDETGTTLIAIGTTLTAIGITSAAISATLSVISSSLGFIGPLIGSTASSFGSTNTDPVDLFGYMKRFQENLEGNMRFTKVSGSLEILSRGSSTLLATKTIANSVSMVLKT